MTKKEVYPSYQVKVTEEHKGETTFYTLDFQKSKDLALAEACKIAFVPWYAHIPLDQVSITIATWSIH